MKSTFVAEKHLKADLSWLIIIPNILHPNCHDSALENFCWCHFQIIGRVRGVGKNRKCPDEKSGLGVFWQTAPRAAPSVTTKPGKLQVHHQVDGVLRGHQLQLNKQIIDSNSEYTMVHWSVAGFNLNIIRSIFSVSKILITFFFIKTVNLNFTVAKMFRRNSANIQFFTLPRKTNSSNQAVKVEREEFRRVDKRLGVTEW